MLDTGNYELTENGTESRIAKMRAAMKAKKEALAKVLGFVAKEPTLAKEVALLSTGGSNNKLINKLFGIAPKVGDKVDLLAKMKVMPEAKEAFSGACQARWAKQGIKVELEGTNLVIKEIVA